MMNRPSVPDALTAEPSRLFSWLFQAVCFRLARAVLHSLHLLLRHSQATILAWAKAYLRAVHIEMNVESTKEMMENIKCYDDLSFGAGRIDG